MEDVHKIYIGSFVVVIVVLVIVVCAVALSKESFADSVKGPLGKTRSGFVDTVVPQNLRYGDVTPTYQGLGNGLRGTSVVNVSAIDSNRFPIAIETPTNWYNTQGVLTKKGKRSTDLNFPKGGTRLGTLWGT